MSGKHNTRANPAISNPLVMPWFVRGDIDGFFGLALDNFVQLLLIDTLCRTVLGSSGRGRHGDCSLDWFGHYGPGLPGNPHPTRSGRGGGFTAGSGRLVAT